MKEPSEEMDDSKALYLLIYCRGCYNTVHWNCIGTDISVLEIKKGKGSYYFFECDAQLRSVTLVTLNFSNSHNKTLLLFEIQNTRKSSAVLLSECDAYKRHGDAQEN